MTLLIPGSYIFPWAFCTGWWLFLLITLETVQYQEGAQGQTHLHSPESHWIVTTLAMCERLNWRKWTLHWVVILEIAYWGRWTFGLSSVAFCMFSVLMSCWNLIKGRILLRSLWHMPALQDLQQGSDYLWFMMALEVITNAIHALKNWKHRYAV